MQRNLATTSTSSHTLTVNAYTWPQFGKAILTCNANTGIALSSEICINTNTVGASPKARQGTITHEIGHLFGLKDDPNTTESSLMKHPINTINREIFFLSQFIDVYHVLNNYS